MSHPDKEYLQKQLDDLKGLTVVDVYVDEDTTMGYTECWPVLVFDSAQKIKDQDSFIAYAISSDMEGNGPGYLMPLDVSD
ncbi:hypothetical protein CL620_06280 [archaeon]|jgi:hypothetical protein|nr:hypothetical protein [archaeon]|tara:strand:+ start:256 stop:495 length:240 start_codon:yes stop_codon:yes gene_type:complete